jgi:MFS family permease
MAVWNRPASASRHMSDLASFPIPKWRRIPSGVWTLGFVSLLMDVSSEMIHALLPLYLVTVLGTSTLTVGFIEGIAEATAAITKVFSGALSDWLGRRKLLVVLGYGLAAFTKPVFPMASTVGWLIAARFVDRIGKGIRGAPRDALVADLTPPELHGASFGLRQSLDTIGAFMGPVLAVAFMWWLANNFVVVFWIAVIPAFLSFALIAVAVREPERPADIRKVRMPLSPAELRCLGSIYWWVVGLATVFTLARFSEAFLILRAQSIGLPIMWAPVVMIVMNIVYALSAYPAGVISDKVNRATLMLAGLAFLLASDLFLALSSSILGIVFGVVLWGLHMGFTQGIFAALIADAAPAQLRGTAFGVFNFATGVALLFASLIAGALWDARGPEATFLAGALFALLTLAGLLPFRRGLRRRERI